MHGKVCQVCQATQFSTPTPTYIYAYMSVHKPCTHTMQYCSVRIHSVNISSHLTQVVHITIYTSIYVSLRHTLTIPKFPATYVHVCMLFTFI